MHTNYPNSLPAISRRSLMRGFGACAAAGAFVAAGLPSRSASAQAPGKPANLITKRIPSTGEVLPAIGLGTFLTFDTLPGAPRGHLMEVMRRFWDNGGRVFDTSPLYGTAETSVGDFATALGITNEMFVANKIWSTGDFLSDDSHARRSVDTSMHRLWRERLDVLQCHSLVNVDVAVPLMRAWKKEGLVRYVGVTHHEPQYFDILATWIEKGVVDFVQVHYSIHTRAAEERVLKAAAAKGVAVLVNMPFEKARLFKAVAGQPLPAFAKDIGVDNWAAYFLKWAISHPAVTCAIPATTNPDHVLENMSAMRGELPDEKMRARMAQHMETIPAFKEIAQMPWYPDKKFVGVINRSQQELRART